MEGQTREDIAGDRVDDELIQSLYRSETNIDKQVSDLDWKDAGLETAMFFEGATVLFNPELAGILEVETLAGVGLDRKKRSDLMAQREFLEDQINTVKRRKIDRYASPSKKGGQPPADTPYKVPPALPGQGASPQKTSGGSSSGGAGGNGGSGGRGGGGGGVSSRKSKSQFSNAKKVPQSEVKRKMPKGSRSKSPKRKSLKKAVLGIIEKAGEHKYLVATTGAAGYYTGNSLSFGSAWNTTVINYPLRGTTVNSAAGTTDIGASKTRSGDAILMTELRLRFVVNKCDPYLETKNTVTKVRLVVFIDKRPNEAASNVVNNLIVDQGATATVHSWQGNPDWKGRYQVLMDKTHYFQSKLISVSMDNVGAAIQGTAGIPYATRMMQQGQAWECNFHKRWPEGLRTEFNSAQFLSGDTATHNKVCVAYCYDSTNISAATIPKMQVDQFTTWIDV